MLVGGFMWAYIIGAVCGTVATMDPNKVKYQQRYDEARASSDARARAPLSERRLLARALGSRGPLARFRAQVNHMLADLAVEHGLGTRVRAFLLQCEERQRRSGYAALFETLSEQIQADLVEHVYARSLSSVTYFRARSVEFRLDVFKVRARPRERESGTRARVPAAPGPPRARRSARARSARAISLSSGSRRARRRSASRCTRRPSGSCGRRRCTSS